LTLHVEVVSPERILWTGESDRVIARTIGGGDIAFLTGHAPFVGALDIHPVRVHLEDGSEEHIAVHGGFVEVSNDRVTVLSDVAEVSSQIDVDRAHAAKARAEEALRGGDDEEAEAALRRAEVRLAVATGATAGATAAH
jgi:F-type H+-transporting ATPase subunit epsilon